jgi:putative DNA primase/helicase
VSVNNRLNTQHLARLLGGRAHGNVVYCPGPGHSRRDRSLSVLITGDDIVVHSFAGDDWRECSEYVRATAGLPPWKPSGDPREQRAARERRRQRERARRLEDERKRSEIARAIWEQGIDPRGTAAEEYLRSRALELPAATELRFHPQCVWHKDEDHPEYLPGWKPTLLAAFRSLESDEVVAIHRIRVDVPQRWPKTLRAMLGPVRNAAVKLAPITDTLAIAEGVETAMAANIMGYGPAWALGSATAIADLPVLPGIERLILLAENDERGVSREATDRCRSRWLRAARKVTRVWPDEGHSDLNDELMGEA